MKVEGLKGARMGTPVPGTDLAALPMIPDLEVHVGLLDAEGPGTVSPTPY